MLEGELIAHSLHGRCVVPVHATAAIVTPRLQVAFALP
jgi:hypothetical protein